MKTIHFLFLSTLMLANNIYPSRYCIDTSKHLDHSDGFDYKKPYRTCCPCPCGFPPNLQENGMSAYYPTRLYKHSPIRDRCDTCLHYHAGPSAFLPDPEIETDTVIINDHEIRQVSPSNTTCRKD